jgi:4-oxalocrotonate tautomerase
MFLKPMAPTSVRAPSAGPTDVLVLVDGTRLRLRPLGSEDRDGFAALFARLSPESRYRRFLSPKRELTPRELSDFTDIDHIRHVAFAAIDQRDGSIVGVGRYVQIANRPNVAEFAVEVADELQNMGIGTALAKHTVQRARDNGFALLTATTLWENRSARALLRRFEFHAYASDGSEIELALKLDASSDGPESTPAIERKQPPKRLPRQPEHQAVRGRQRRAAAKAVAARKTRSLHHQPTKRRSAMPLINVKLIEGVFTSEQKAQIAERLTDAMVSVEGENMRGVTWCVLEEVKSGDWAIGGQCLTTEAVHALAAGVSA